LTEVLAEVPAATGAINQAEGQMKVNKIINHERFRFWVFPKNSHMFYVWRKRLKRFGYIIFLGQVRISFTVVK
jgi:hypothetical protein